MRRQPSRQFVKESERKSFSAIVSLYALSFGDERSAFWEIVTEIETLSQAILERFQRIQRRKQNLEKGSKEN